MAAKDIKNPWRDGLLPASYDSNEFFVDVASRQSGNRLVNHQFPKKDQNYLENMGRKAREFRVRGYVIQSARRPDYRPARDALQDSLEKGMAGKAAQLQLPSSRPMAVLCQTYSWEEDRRLGGYCVFDMHFVEAGGAPFKPTAAPQQQLTQKATALESQTTSGLSSGISVAGHV